MIPKTIVKLYNTSVEALKTGDSKTLQEALKLQDIGASPSPLLRRNKANVKLSLVSDADWCIVKAGIGGTKYALDHFIAQGLGGEPRNPLPSAEAATRTMVDKGMAVSIAYEKTL